jgi:hypothetical protein
MLNCDNRQLDIPAYVRVAKLLPLLVIALGLGYATAIRVEDSQIDAGNTTAMKVEDSQIDASAGNTESAGISLSLIGVSSAYADQHRMEPQGVPYFPDGYVNQARDRSEHIQAF